MRAGDPHVVAIQHRRNFGKAQALANGFALASGNSIITMDGDLQDDPDEIPRMLDKLNEGYDLVSGWKQHRQDPRGKTAPSKLFNWTVRTVTGVQLHDFNCGFKAYRREVTDTIRVYGELHRFTPVLGSQPRGSVLPSFRSSITPAPGKSKYGLKRLFKGFLDLITVFFLTNYRQRPMHLFGIPGIISVALGVLMGLEAVVGPAGQRRNHRHAPAPAPGGAVDRGRGAILRSGVARGVSGAGIASPETRTGSLLAPCLRDWLWFR